MGNLKILHLLCGGGTGGIEVLCLALGKRARLDHRFLMLWKPGEISAEMARAGLRAEVYDTGPNRYFSDFLRFVRLCREERIDVLLCHQAAPLMVLYALGVSALLPKLRILGYAHSNPRDWDAKERFFRKLLYRRCERVICVSETVQEDLRDFLGTGGKLKLLYNGVETEVFAPSRHEPARDRLELVYVGRLHPVKGVDSILRGLAGLDIPFRLRIAGEGPQRRALEELRDALGLGNTVTFLGNCRDVPELYRDADIFVHLPNWEEGFGITVVEAMAAGLLCIGNTRGALPELIRDGVNGFLVTEKRPFPDILREIFRRPDWRSIQENAVRRAEDFAMDRYVQTLEEWLKAGAEEP